MRHRLAAALIALSLLAACTPPVATAPAAAKRKAGTGTRKTGALTPVPPGQVAQIVAPPGGTPLVSDKGGQVVANNGGTIVTNNGAAVVANNGSGMIANNGAGLSGTVRVPAQLVSNHSAGYRLAQLEQPPLAGATVRVLDAAGQAVLDDAGRPLAAVTDAEGRYAFTGELPTQNLLLAVTLADGRGEVQAVLPGSPAGPAARQVDLDLISTLTTAYIVDQYVAKGEGGRQATLDKLPADVEAATRLSAGAAFAASGAAVPASLTPTDVVPAVAALRQAAPAFDAQMEAVKRLLIAGGFLDLGNGKPATQVALNYVTQLAPAPDGTLYIMAEYDNRVWHLRKDGRLETAAGTGGPADETFAGKQASQVGLPSLTAIAVDPQGRLLILADTVLRVGLDGKIEVLADDVTWLRGGSIMAGDGDDVYFISSYTWDNTAEFYSVTAAGVRKVGKLDFGKGTGIEGAGRGADGKIRAALVKRGGGVDMGGSTTAGKAAGVWLIDPATGALSLERAGSFMVDAGGHVFKSGGPGIQRVDPDGAAHDVGPGSIGVTVTDDGAGGAYYSAYYQVFHVGPQGSTHVAGIAATGPIDADAADFGYQDPSGLAVGADGTMYVSDHGMGRILAVSPAGRVKNLEPAGSRLQPRVVRLDPAGNPCFLGSYGQGGVQRLRNGAIETIADDEHMTFDFVIGADGAVYASTWWWTGEDNFRITCTRNGQTTTVLEEQPDRTSGVRGFALAVAPDGGLLIVGGGKLRRWTAAGGVTTVATNDALDIENGFGSSEGSAAGVALDARGRLAIAQGASVVRYDPATDAVETLAGAGGKVFTGTGVDDGVREAGAPAYAPDGSLLFIDTANRQIRRIPKDRL